MFKNTFFWKMLSTFLISMVPVVELRGAIPIGVGSGLPVLLSMIISIIGNMLPVPFIILFIRKFFGWLRSKHEKLDLLVTKIEARAIRKSDLVRKYAFFGLFIFVAIPIPGTGAWTGAIIAALLDIRFKIALPAILLGVVVASIIVSVLTYGVTAFIF